MLAMEQQAHFLLKLILPLGFKSFPCIASLMGDFLIIIPTQQFPKILSTYRKKFPKAKQI